MKLIKRSLMKIPMEPCPPRQNGMTTMIRTAVMLGGELLVVTFYRMADRQAFYRVHITLDGRTVNLDYRTGQWSDSDINHIMDDGGQRLCWFLERLAYASKADETAGRKFFGYKDDATFRAVWRCQDERKRSIRRKQEETAEQITARVLGDAPTTIPEDAVQWALEHPLAHYRYLFYHTEKHRNPLTGEQEKVIKGYCTHCHNDVELPFEPGHKIEWKCPVCGSNVQAMAERYSHTKLVHDAKMRIFLKNERGAVYVQLIDLRLDYSGVFRGSRLSYAYAAFYYFNTGEAYEFRPWRSYKDSGWEKIGGVYEISGYDETYPIPEDFFNDTCLKHSHLTDYMRPDHYGKSPMMYLAAYVKNPSLEYLLGYGLKRLVHDKVHHRGFNGQVLDFFKTRPRDILGVSQPEVDLFKENGWNCAEVYGYKTCKAAGFIPGDEDMKLISSFADREPKLYRKLFRPENARQIMTFLRRQYKRYTTTYNLFSDWRDYMKECEELGYDLADPLNAYPPDLIKAHKKTIALLQQMRAEEARLKSEAEAKQYRKELEKRAYLAYTDETAGLFIRPAQSRQELVSEGAALHHCVGGYAESHLKGQTTILFIRRISEPDEPYFTLEFRAGKINQNRGKGNCDPPDEVIAFAEKWLREIAAKKPKQEKTEIRVQVAVA